MSSVVTLVCLVGCPAYAVETMEEPEFPVRMIWNEGKHNAFTDLARFQGRMFCTFREGTGHVPGEDGMNGGIRVICSPDGDTWRSVDLLEEEGVDLRDPKLSVTPDGRLMVVMGGSFYDGEKLLARHSRISFSDARGRNFSDPKPVVLDPEIATDDDWLWRVTWHEETAYGAVYHQIRPSERAIHLVKSLDGVHYAPIVKLNLDGFPNESTLRFLPDGEMLMVVRRESGDRNGLLGRAEPPYTSWTWYPIEHRLGGPNFRRLPNGTLVLGTRAYQDTRRRTVLGTLGLDGHFDVRIVLPSGGDTSYPGLLVHDNELWVSYYSSHEGHASIYLARIPLYVVTTTGS